MSARQTTEAVHTAESWGVRFATGEVRPEGQGYYAMRAAEREVARIARNAAAEVGRSGPGIGWSTAAHPAVVVSRTVTTTIQATEWQVTLPPGSERGGDA